VSRQRRTAAQPAPSVGPPARQVAPPGAGGLIRTLVRARIGTRGYALQVVVTCVLGALAGHTAAATGQATATPAVVRNFEAYLAVMVILGAGLEALAGLGAPPAWLRPLFTRRLPRAALPLGVVLAGTLAWALLWTSGAVAYRSGGAIGGAWHPAPALARLPAVWSSVLAAGAYGAACAALMGSRAAALGLAIAYPMGCVLVAVRWAAAHPGASAPPPLLRVPFLLFPPLEARPDVDWALQYGAYGIILVTVLALAADRWVGRIP
jgi:hypothetical protein